MARVGFVIRTKNEGVWLGRVLESLYSQTYTDFDVTIVDSGSTDRTLEIVRCFPQIRLIEILPEDFNYSYALNIGIEQSNSEYICIISGHSLPYSRRWLESGVRHLDADTTVAAVTGHYMDLPDAPIAKRIAGFVQRLKWKKQDKWPGMTNTNALIRRSMWSEYKFDETLPECEDYDWALEVLSRGYNVILEPKFSVYHSHYHVPGAKSFDERMIVWKQINTLIDQRKRPFGKTEILAQELSDVDLE